MSLDNSTPGAQPVRNDAQRAAGRAVAAFAEELAETNSDVPVVRRASRIVRILATRASVEAYMASP